METFLFHIFLSIGIKKKANGENQEETVSYGFPLFSNVFVCPNLPGVRSNLYVAHLFQHCTVCDKANRNMW